MSGRTIGMCINVEGFLRHSKFPQDFRDVFSSKGRTLSPVEARDSLRMELYRGRKVIPCSEECGNPCKHADRGCTGFDYAGGGCPGRESDHA